MKEGKHTGKIKNLMEPSDGNENKMMKTKVEYDGEENGATSKATEEMRRSDVKY